MAGFEDQFADSETEFVEPLAITVDVGDAEPFPVEALGNYLAGAVDAIAARVRVPPALAAQSVLAAASLAVQPFADIRLPFGARKPLSLYLVSIADSSDRKSTSDEEAMAEVKAFQRELNEAQSAKMAEHASALEAWKVSRSQTKTQHRDAGQTALREALDSLGPEPEAPWSPIIITSAPTTQYLLKHFAISRPSLALMSNEGGAWLGGYSMGEDNRLATISTLSSLWDGDAIQRATVGEGAMLLYGRRLSFHMMVQPIVAAQLLGDKQNREQGFLNRVLPAAPRSLAGSRIVDPDETEPAERIDAMARYHKRIGLIVRSDLPFDEEKNALDPALLRLDDAAARLWWSFSNHLEGQIGPGGELEDIKGFAGKLAEQAARIAGVLHMIDEGRNNQLVRPETLERAIRIAEFYLGETKRLAGLASPDQVLLDARRLSEWLETKWTEPLIGTAVVLQKGPYQLRKTTDYLYALFEVLERHSHVSPRLPKGGVVDGKKRKIAWRVIVGRQPQQQARAA